MRCDGRPVRPGTGTTQGMSKASQPDEQNGTLFADTIRASSLNRLHQQAGQKTAPDQCHCVNLALATREPSTEDIGLDQHLRPVVYHFSLAPGDDAMLRTAEATQRSRRNQGLTSARRDCDGHHIGGHYLSNNHLGLRLDALRGSARIASTTGSVGEAGPWIKKKRCLT